MGDIDRDYLSFSSLLGTGGEPYMAISVGVTGLPQLFSICAGYHPINQADVTNIQAGRLLIFKGEITEQGFDVYDLSLKGKTILWDVPLNSFEPYSHSFAQNPIQGSEGGVVSIVLCPAYRVGDSDGVPSQTIGRLSIHGANRPKYIGNILVDK